jgi:hypothetical protein
VGLQVEWCLILCKCNFYQFVIFIISWKFLVEKSVILISLKYFNIITQSLIVNVIAYQNFLFNLYMVSLIKKIEIFFFKYINIKYYVIH